MRPPYRPSPGAEPTWRDAEVEEAFPLRRRSPEELGQSIRLDDGVEDGLDDDLDDGAIGTRAKHPVVRTEAETCPGGPDRRGGRPKGPIFSRDGTAYAYGYSRSLSQVHVATGLR